jgi:hypothetical protein
MNREENGLIKLNQSGLIDRILRVMGLENSLERSTPADKKGLGKHEESDPCSFRTLELRIFCVYDDVFSF